jgi:hypothetical protein
MQLRTQPRKGSFVGMTMGPNGVPIIHGDGNATAVITAEILDADRNVIGVTNTILTDVISECESLIQDLGLKL